LNELSHTDVLIDANLLIVGLVDPRWVDRHKNTARYRSGDFNLLTKLLAPAQTVVVTPHIAIEASNLLRQTRPALRQDLGQTPSRVLEATREVCVASVAAAQDKALTALPDDLALLTDDADLYVAATQRGLPAVKFSHRQAAEV
jgi:hypothetical protein